MKSIFWMPLLTDHVSYTLEEYQVISDSDVIIYITMLDDPKRLAQGWHMKKTNTLNIHLILSKIWIIKIFETMINNRNVNHIILSPFYNMRTITILLAALIFKLRFSIISEPYSIYQTGYLDDNNKLLNRLKYYLRPMLYKIYGYFIKNRVENIFAISSLACRQFQQMGVDIKKIYPFGYFVPKIDKSSNNPQGVNKGNKNQKKCLNIVFIGNLIEIKGLYDLIVVVKKLNLTGVSIKLDVYGPGDKEKYEFDNNVQYCGVIPFGTTQNIVKMYDALILPSYYDGWGVTVNESILSGVPVVCSSNVGACGVVRKWGCGIVYEQAVPNSLYSALHYLSNNDEALLQMKNLAFIYRENLEPKVAAYYMNDVLNNDTNNTVVKSNPWYW
jgi:glycosyltransferase involved in cell wall biosynthesis